MPSKKVVTEEQPLVQEIKKRQAKLEKLRKKWEEHWDDIIDFIQPRRRSIKHKSDPDHGLSESKRIGKQIYDGSPTTASEILSNGIFGNMVSPSYKWFKMELPIPEIRDIREVKIWLQDCEERLYEVFRGSNFYDSMGEHIDDGVNIGTATMFIENRIEKDMTMYLPRHPREMYLSENMYGEVDTAHRKFDLEIRQAVDMFGEENLERELLEKYEKNPYQKVRFIHAIYPRKDRLAEKIDSKNKAWASVYIWENGREIIREGGYDVFPYATWRYRKNSDEVYGISPASEALVDIMALNQMSKDLLKIGHRAADPPVNAPASMMGRIRLTPGGINYYQEANEIIQPLNQGLNFPIGKDREQSKQEIIKQHFKVDFFLMLAQIERTMTATEIVERQGEKAVILGPVIGRLTRECLKKVIDRTFILESKAGRMPEPPSVLDEYGGHEIRIDYLGPLAQAQKRLFKTQGIMRSLESWTPILQMQPEVGDLVDWDKLTKEIFDSYGMPQEILKDERLVAQIRQQRVEQMARQQQLEEAQAMGEATDKMRRKVEPDSVLSNIAENTRKAIRGE